MSEAHAEKAPHGAESLADKSAAFLGKAALAVSAGLLAIGIGAAVIPSLLVAAKGMFATLGCVLPNYLKLLGAGALGYAFAKSQGAPKKKEEAKGHGGGH